MTTTRTCFLALIITSSSLALLAALLLNSSNYISWFRSNSDQPIKKQDDMAAATGDDSWKNAKTIYEFEVKNIDGETVKMDKYKGRVVLIVNVACMCGFTNGNYPELEELHEKYSEQGLSVLAFPCNQFGGQEPGSEAEIKEFVQKFNVKFDMFSKINVNGDTAHPLYKFLKDKQSGVFGDFIKWNFSKFLVDRNGVPINRYAPTTSPKAIEKDILKQLETKASL